MKLGPIEILLIALGTLVLTLIALWVREELLDWRSSRPDREAKRRRGPRR